MKTQEQLRTAESIFAICRLKGLIQQHCSLGAVPAVTIHSEMDSGKKRITLPDERVICARQGVEKR